MCTCFYPYMRSDGALDEGGWMSINGDWAKADLSWFAQGVGAKNSRDCRNKHFEPSTSTVWMYGSYDHGWNNIILFYFLNN